MQGGRTVAIHDVEGRGPPTVRDGVVEDLGSHDATAGESLLLLVPWEDGDGERSVSRSVTGLRLVRVAAQHAAKLLVLDLVAHAEPRLLLDGHEVVELRHVGLPRLPGRGVEGRRRHRSPVTTGVTVAVDGDVLRDGDFAVGEPAEQVLDRVGERVVAGHEVSFEADVGDEPHGFSRA